MLPSQPVATNPPMDLVLAPLGGEPRSLDEWLTTFHLASVVLDPYTNESSWILPTATRILEGLRGSNARVNFLVTADDDDSRAFLGPLTERFLVFTDPDRVAVKALGLTELPAFVFIRVDGTVPSAAEGWSAAVVARRRRRRGRRDGVAAPRHPHRRRSRPLPRVARRRLTLRLPDLPIVEVLDDLRAALAGGTRAVVAAPPGAGKTTVIPLALLDEPWLSGRRIVVLEPRRLATRAAARRMADLTATEVGGLVGYQTRDERRIGPATRIEVVTEGVLTRRLQQDPELPGVGLVVFDEVHERNLTTDLGLALTLDAAATLRPGPAHRRHVGHRRHRQLRPPARRRADPRERRADAPGRHPLATTHEGRAPRTGRHGGRADGAARRGRRRARLPPRRRRDHADRRASRHLRRGRPPPRWRTQPRRAGQGARAVAARPATRRARHRHRRDVADGRGRQHRRRQRAGPSASLRRRHRDDPPHHGVDQPRLGGPARRPRRPPRTGCGLPPVEPDGARHPPRPSRRRDHPGRPRRAGARAGWLGHATGRAVVPRPPAGQGVAPGERAADRARRARRRRRHHLARPAHARPPRPPAAGADDRRATGRAVVRRRRPRRRARHRPRP